MSSRFDEDMPIIAIDDREFKATDDTSKKSKADDCGTGAGGFKPGNDCAEGHGRPPSDRRSGPVTREEEMAFSDFSIGMRRTWNQNRNDPSQITRDADGNEYEEHEVESGASIGYFDNRQEGVEKMKQIQAELTPREKEDLKAWSRNGETVVDFFRRGESRLDRTGKKAKEFQDVLDNAWDDEVLDGIDSETDAVNVAQSVVYASNRLEGELRTAHSVLINQIPKSESGDSVIADDRMYQVLESVQEYDQKTRDLTRLIDQPANTTTEEIVKRVRELKKMQPEALGPLKSYFKEVQDLEGAYIDRLSNSLDKRIRSDGKPVTAWRGVRVIDAGSKRLYDDIIKGDDRFEFTSVNSASLSSSVAAQFSRADATSEGPAIVFKITARKGVAIGTHSQYEEESEILLPPRSNARITSKKLVFSEMAQKPVLYVEMEMEDE